MDSQRFDSLSRALAGGASRRSVLRAMAAVVAGGVLGVHPRTAPSVRAAATCQGQPFDPSFQCCTPSGIQTRSPITDLAVCPDKVANPTNVAESNGCGSGPLGGLVPNSFREADFSTSCDAHDVCYETCNTPKATCDQNFLLDLQAACEAAYPPGGDRRAQNLRRACFRRATLYFRAVSILRRGQIAYEDAQKEACLCCAPQCTDCGPCEDCVDGVCQSRCDEGCEQCDEGVCVPLCDPNACEICDGAGGCGSVCDARSCLSCDGQGACVPFCQEGSQCVEGVCESECDPPCDSFQCQACQDGACATTCNPGQCQLCDGAGACVSACDPGESCNNGACVSVCNPPCDVSRCQVCDGGVCVSSCAGDEYCSSGQCLPLAGTCADGIQNNFESDVDRGGSNCQRCGLGKRCAHDSHCQSFNCIGGVCGEVVCSQSGFPQSCFGTHCAPDGFVCCDDGRTACSPGSFCFDDPRNLLTCCPAARYSCGDDCCGHTLDDHFNGLCINNTCCRVGECCTDEGCLLFS